jgi:hypothetical protein
MVELEEGEGVAENSGLKGAMRIFCSRFSQPIWVGDLGTDPKKKHFFSFDP